MTMTSLNNNSEMVVFDISLMTTTSVANSNHAMTTNQSENNSTAALQTTAPAVLFSLAITIGALGIIVNGFLLVSLLHARWYNSSKTNVLVFNQAVIEMFSCIFLIVIYTIRAQGNWIYAGVGGRQLCKIISSSIFIVSGLFAQMANLVVITLERYVMIVHPILHRNHRRDWMSRASIAAPWIYGFAITIPFFYSTTDILPATGMCVTAAFFPSVALMKAYSGMSFFWNYCGVIIIFAYCYTKIFIVIISSVSKISNVSVSSNSRPGNSAACIRNTTHIVLDYNQTDRKGVNYLEGISSDNVKKDFGYNNLFTTNSKVKGSQVSNARDERPTQTNLVSYFEDTDIDGKITDKTNKIIAPKTRNNLQKSVIKTTAIVAITFVLTSGPSQAFVILKYGLQYPIKIQDVFFIVMQIISYLNVFTNPLIYIYKYNVARRSARAIFYRICHSCTNKN